MGGEPVAVVERREVVERDRQQDVRASPATRSISVLTSAARASRGSPRRGGGRELGRGARDAETGRLERLDLGRRRPRTARDDRPGVAHPLALRRRPAGDERDLRHVAEVLGGPGRGLLLGRAADLADQDDRVGVGVRGEQLEDVEERRADDRVAADPDARRLADARVGHRLDRLVGQRPERLTTPTRPSRWIEPGMIPTLAEPGDVAPGQFGADQPGPGRRTTSTAGIMSSAGMPSVMQKIVAIPAAAASMTASGAPAAGTKMQVVFAPVSRTASATVSKTGTAPSSAVWPPLPGVIPATICVPYSCIARLWNSPSRPVMPWTTQPRVRPDEDAHAAAPRDAATAFAAASSSEVAVVKCACLEQDGGLGRVRADDPDDHRDVALLDGPCLDQATGDLVAAGDAAEDVDQDRVDLRVGEDDPHRGGDLVRPRPAADVEEVGRLAAGALDEVHRRHRKPGAVDHAADGPVELDERQPGLARLAVGRVLLVGVAQVLESRVAGEGGVVERDLRVETDEPLDRRAVRSVSRTIASGLISTRSAS